MEQGSISNFYSLPFELRHQIFGWIYTPWHFEYTQVHDNFPDHDAQDIKHVASNLAADLPSTPRFSRLPSIAPLLACKAFHEAGRPVFNSSFTRNIHVISRMFWREVHWSYASIMAQATTLTVDLKHFLSLHQCRILRRMPKLEKAVFIVTDFFTRHNFYPPDMFKVLGNGGVPDDDIICRDEIPLEGFELLKHLPEDVDLSDAHLQRCWNEMIDGPCPFPNGGYPSYRAALDYIFNGTLLATRARIYRVIVALHTIAKDPEAPSFVFLVSLAR